MAEPGPDAASDAARRAAEAASAAKSAFLATLSHEIRTPLGALIGYADMLQEQPDHPDRREWVRTMATTARHLMALLNDLLDLSKIEAGQLELESTPTNLLEVLADLDALLRPEAEARGLDLIIEATGEVPDTLETDPLRLRQILINLLGNALKFTDAGHVALVARVTRRGAEARLRVDVTDTGPGIPPHQLPRLFEAFSQLDAGARLRGGAGLGLSISRRLARLLGGDLTVSSTPGRGSTFTVELPVRLVQGATMVDTSRYDLLAQSRTDAARRAAASPARGRRVLVVDDHRANREIARFLLERRGARVDVAEDGEAGVAAALGRPYDLILMDMQMPRLDGYGATRRLRAAGCRAPVVALTAYAMSGDRTACLAAGCDDYLAKPVEAAALDACLERRLGRAEARGPAAPPPASPPPPVDERLARLTAAYAESLGETAGKIEDALAAGDAAAIGREAHRLAGTAASFGLPDVGRLARGCDERLRAGESLSTTAEEVWRLVGALRAARRAARG